MIDDENYQEEKKKRIRLQFPMIEEKITLQKLVTDQARQIAQEKLNHEEEMEEERQRHHQ